jgi:hypothetical protein
MNTPPIHVAKRAADIFFEKITRILLNLFSGGIPATSNGAVIKSSRTCTVMWALNKYFSPKKCKGESTQIMSKKIPEKKYEQYFLSLKSIAYKYNRHNSATNPIVIKSKCQNENKDRIIFI